MTASMLICSITVGKVVWSWCNWRHSKLIYHLLPSFIDLKLIILTNCSDQLLSNKVLKQISVCSFCLLSWIKILRLGESFIHAVWIKHCLMLTWLIVLFRMEYLCSSTKLLFNLLSLRRSFCECQCPSNQKIVCL